MLHLHAIFGLCGSCPSPQLAALFIYCSFTGSTRTPSLCPAFCILARAMPVSSAMLTPYRATNDNDDAHDQIGSTSSTPPGAVTPRPDPIDKRLPGILHSYFGQVRDSLLPRRKSSAVNPSPASKSCSAQDRPQTAPSDSQETEKETKSRPTMLPSPTPSASSRTPSTSQLTGDTEKLTQGDFASLQNQATPPQTPRTRSQESKPLPTSLSRTTTSPTKSKEQQDCTCRRCAKRQALSIDFRGQRATTQCGPICCVPIPMVRIYFRWTAARCT